MSLEYHIYWYATSHILQELTVPSFVPNDTFITSEKNESEDNSQELEKGRAPSMLLLTGPNYSGKSVYMKQVSRLKIVHTQESLMIV